MGEPGRSGQDIANQDAAAQSLSVAQKAHAAGELEKALKFARKSCSLYDTVAARQLLGKLETPAEAPAPAEPAAPATEPNSEPTGAAEEPAAPPSAGAAPAPTEAADPGAVVVARVLAANTFYEVFDLPNKTPDQVIRKAYRKLAASLHPDKNTAARAEEAFKKVGEALQTLTDPVKRYHYDQSLLRPHGLNMTGLGKPMGPRGAAAAPSAGGAARPNQQSQWMPMGQPHPQALPAHVPSHSLFQLYCHTCNALLQAGRRPSRPGPRPPLLLGVALRAAGPWSPPLFSRARRLRPASALEAPRRVPCAAVGR